VSNVFGDLNMQLFFVKKVTRTISALLIFFIFKFILFYKRISFISKCF